MKEKNIILAARVMSMVFTPFYLPFIGLIALFILSYMSLMPWQYKLMVLTMVYLFTILLPTLLIHGYRRYQGWSTFEIGQKERRMVPYIIAILCYFACYYLMTTMRIPQFMANILLAALMIQVACAIINVWWKISTHSAAVGGMTGLLIVFSEIFGFYLMWWLYLALIISGCVGSSRIILRQHNLSQVLVGYGLGFITSILIIIYI